MPAALMGYFPFFMISADVEVVNVLLDVEVARQPSEVVPVPHLVKHVGPAGLAGLSTGHFGSH
jgi:hypothetical protein